MHYKNPLIIKFTNSNHVNIHDNTVELPANQRWNDFKSTVEGQMKTADFDYVAVSVPNDVRSADLYRSLDFKVREVAKQATNHNVPAVNRFGVNLYQLNAQFKEGSEFMPQDEDVLAKYNKYQEQNLWASHQDIVWKRVAVAMPLSKGGFNQENHVEALTEKSRGLEPKDLGGFFTLKGNTVMIPGLLHDDLVGMPGFIARKTEDTYSIGNTVMGEGALSIRTLPGNGYTIPMRDENGYMTKFQIGTDSNSYNTIIKARTADGVSIQKSEYYDKNKRVYLFKDTNGNDMELKIVDANNKDVVFEDLHGQFGAPMKANIKDTLIERGYDIPDIIDNLKALPNAKYKWPAPGSMAGSTEVSKVVTPSNAGFIPVREPQTPDGKYTVMIVEGALKGHITAKYLQNENCKGVTDAVAGNNGLIVAQVPGVSKAFVESVNRIYDKYPVEKTVVAMDADGRQNRSVAKGIHDSVNLLGQYAPISVMSWNPEQKGIDDALLAMSRKEITLDDMGLEFGSAHELFPLDKAEMPNPYKLDGTRANGNGRDAEWQLEYREGLAKREAHVKEIQEQSKEKRSDIFGVTRSELVERLSSGDKESIDDFVKSIETLQHDMQSLLTDFVAQK